MQRITWIRRNQRAVCRGVLSCNRAAGLVALSCQSMLNFRLSFPGFLSLFTSCLFSCGPGDKVAGSNGTGGNSVIVQSSGGAGGGGSSNGGANKQLVIDLGGRHAQFQGSVVTDSLGLTLGAVYELAVFHAERHSTESNFQIQTTLAFTSCGQVNGQEIE